MTKDQLREAHASMAIHVANMETPLNGYKDPTWDVPLTPADAAKIQKHCKALDAELKAYLEAL